MLCRWVIVASDNLGQVLRISKAYVALGLLPVIAALSTIKWLSQLWCDTQQSQRDTAVRKNSRVRETQP